MAAEKLDSVRFPLQHPPGYVPRHVQLGFPAKSLHAHMLAELYHGMLFTGAQLDSKKEVSSLADALRYLIEFAHRHGVHVEKHAA